MKTDIEIAQRHRMKPIDDLAKKARIPLRSLEHYGRYKAKISFDFITKARARPQGKLILVTAITPTKAGEGKTTTTIGVGDALTLLHKKSMICLREPSMGPVFGIKGGAAGGGYSQVVPMEDINLHFTGDFHAITSANNLVSAILDNHIFSGNPLNIDPQRVVWKRAMDMNDRALRQIEVARGPKNGTPRPDGFQITVASEIMAILCLSKDLEDLKQRVARCIVAYTFDDRPVTLGELGVVGAVAVLLKDAIKPNLVQSLDGTPVLIHGGPFANIAHGANSVVATDLALHLSDYVVTEAGFGADLGAEKFFDITCREAGFAPQFVVVVATIRALKMHGGVAKEALKEPDCEALMQGVDNLAKHLENVQQFGVPYAVAINRFPTDSPQEIQTLLDWCEQHNHPAYLSDVYRKGGKGALSLAEHIVTTLKHASPIPLQPLYPMHWTPKQKIEHIATHLYGAKDVEYSMIAEEDLARIEHLGYNAAYVCMAKTPNSLSDNEKLYGRPRDFTLHVKEVRLSAGANFVIPLTGSILTMPGLNKQPSALQIDIDTQGAIKGLF